MNETALSVSGSTPDTVTPAKKPKTKSKSKPKPPVKTPGIYPGDLPPRRLTKR